LDALYQKDASATIDSKEDFSESFMEFCKEFLTENAAN